MKKIISILLCIMMVFSLVPTAFAEGEEGTECTNVEWGDPTYTWEEDGSCTATIICKNCDGTESGHKITEKATISSEVTTPATCTVKGTTTYTATFTDSKFEAQSIDKQDIALAAHTLTKTAAKAATCLATGNNDYWTCSICKQVFSDSEGKNVTTVEAETLAIDSSNHVNTENKAKVEPTCLDIGYEAGVYCNDCKAWISGHAPIAATGHSYGAWISNGDGTHTKTCANDASHTVTEDCSGGTATCTEKAICSICNTAYGTVDANNHDLVHHNAKAATCTEIGWDAYDTCSRCDYTTYKEIAKLRHNYGAAEYTWTKSGDTYTCTGVKTCANDASHKITETATVTVKSTAATCVNEGSKVYTATFTDTENFTEQTKTDKIDKLAHSYTGEIKSDGNGKDKTHSYKCVNGCNEYGNATAHTWDSGNVTTAATCTQKGEKTYTCRAVGCCATYTEPIEKLGHEFTSMTREDTYRKSDATCQKAAVYYYKCSRCTAKGSNTYEYGDPSEHDYISKTTISTYLKTSATCTSPAVYYYKCSMCEGKNDQFTYEYGSSLGHDYVEHEAKERNCTEIGWETYVTCSRCDYTTYKEIAKLGHDWNEGTVTTQPTCTEKGVKTFTCQREGCGATKTEEVNATGHTMTKTEAKAATCLETGNNEYYYCSNCEKYFNEEAGTTQTTVADETITAIGHDMTKTDAKSATCTEAGNNEYYYCNNCKKYFKEEAGTTETNVEAETITATGHDMTKTPKKAATCTSTGNNEYWTCSTCKKVFKDDAGTTPTTVKAETIAKKAHSFTGKTQTKAYAKKAATCTTKGTYYYKCANCSAKGTKTYTVKALGHSYTSKTQTKTYRKSAATCIKAAVYYYKCARCSAKGTKTYTSGKALGHNYKVTKTTKATLTKNGSVVKKCSRCSAKTTTTIYMPKTITLSQTSYTCTGKAIKPTVTVKDANGKTIASSNYTVKYSNNKNPTYKGSLAKVTVTFKGNYSGTKTLTFNIKLGNVEKTTIKKDSNNKYNVTVTWTKVPGATGYKIEYNMNGTGFKSMGVRGADHLSFNYDWKQYKCTKLQIKITPLFEDVKNNYKVLASGTSTKTDEITFK